MNKIKALEIIEQMPESFQVDQLIEKLIFIDKIEEGLRDIKDGNVLIHDEIVRQVSSWAKK